jgi:hypothetical protein
LVLYDESLVLVLKGLMGGDKVSMLRFEVLIPAQLR